VTANDGKGGTNTATATVTVNSIPVANAGGPYAGTVGQSISFSGAGATDADGDSLNYSWDFGDGSQGTGVNATHAYSVSGSFTVSLTVDDGHGAINTAMAVATIASAGTVPIPSLSITAPSPLALFNQNTITVTGTVDSTATSVTVNGVAATIAGGSFTANNVPLREGNNLLTATALNAAGGAGTSTVSVTLDTTPPTVTIDSPSDSALLGSSQITVSGMVNDLVSGTVNGGDVTVTVNGVTASVSNRSFVVNNLLLVPGVNSITAIATDRAGNHSQTQVQVTLQSVVNQQRIVLISGNNQAGVVGSVLQQPLSVQLVDANGGPISSRAVTFSVAKNNGVLLAPPAVGRQITLPTDSNGFASVQLQVGTRVGAGNNVVAVTSIGFVGEVTFSESSLVGGQAQINAYSGDGQRGAAGQPLPEPLVVLVTDSGGNPVAGAPVTFTVSSGAGTIAGAPTATPLTDGNGRAAVIFTLSNEEGISNNQVAATVQGLTGFAATFSASGLVPGDAASTTVSGIILDNTDTAIANATATIVGTNLSALSDAQGNFTIANAPVGKIVLLIDGRSSSRPETFPTLSFDLVTLAGQDNTVGGPIYLPPLDTVNSQIVGGDQDVVLQMDGVPGYSFTVFAHSVTFADGSHVGRVSLSQVHSDKVPMAPPNGTGPRIAGTLQPAGVHFNPPIRVQFPNTDGLAPGTVLDVYSFDHDMNTWASQGPARVSPDGSVIVSDRGFGIAKSGWHFAPPPPPPNTCTGDQECRKCVDGGQCENSPRCTPCSIGACDGQGSCRKGRDWLSDAGVCSTVTVNYNFLRTDTAATAWAKSHNGAPAPADLCGGVSVYQVLSVSANCNGTALDLSGATLQEHLQVISDSCPFGSPRSGNACKVGPGGSVTGQNAPYCLDTMGGAAPYSAVKSKMGTAPSCTQVVQQTFNVDSCLANTFHILTNTMTNTGSTCSAGTTLQ
jgi:predicted methyltransferase MtxX (methanogen marker protein 4)